MNVVLCKHSVATAQGKRGIWKSTFQDGENREFAKILKNMFCAGNSLPTQGKFRVEKK